MPLFLFAGISLSYATDFSLYNFGWPTIANETRSMASSLQLMDEHAEHRGKTPPSVEYVNQYLAGGEDPHDVLWILSRPRDMWGNPYRFRRDISLPGGTTIDFGIYSVGEDGVSASAGDDPDDLNSWNDACWEYYMQRDRIRLLRMHCVRGIPWALGLGVIFYLFAYCRQSRRAEPTG